MPRVFALALKYPRLAALLLGVVSAFGFEPWALWPLALLGLAGLIGLLRLAPTRRAAAGLGWSFGLGQFAIGLNWIATAFTYQAAMPYWLGWLAVVLLAIYLAVYPALATLAAWHARANSLALVLALAGSWIAAEWLRGWVFTGFPWNPQGAVLLGTFDHPGAAQALPWLGTYALSGLAVLMAGMWQAGLGNYRRGRRAVILLLLPLLIQIVPTLVPPNQDRPSKVPFALVQPNIPQAELNDPAKFPENFQRLARLVPPSSTGPTTLILWPESGVSDYLRSGYPPDYYIDTFGADPALARARLGRLVADGRVLLTGTVDLEFRGDHPVGARNTVTAIDSTGALTASYSKAHLVPYGEYLPMRSMLTPLGLNRLVPGDFDFLPGPGPQTLGLGQMSKVGIQICYEIVFPGHVIDASHRPEFLFNPSNDGWFGTWGPPQHLAQARMRAIEEGMPVLRSTTTGISAVIDANGVVRQSIPLNAAGVLIGQVPAAHAPTLFARWGNLLSLGWAMLLLGASLVALRRRQG
ncbi:MAG: apolipoprotein N-acyltransferase [Novosphingobium sp.]